MNIEEAKMNIEKTRAACVEAARAHNAAKVKVEEEIGAIRAETCPEGFGVKEFTSNYWGSHPERGYGDETIYVAVRKGNNVSGVQFSHGTGSYAGWIESFKSMPGAYYWNEEEGEYGAWVSAEEEMFHQWE